MYFQAQKPLNFGLVVGEVREVGEPNLKPCLVLGIRAPSEVTCRARPWLQVRLREGKRCQPILGGSGEEGAVGAEDVGGVVVLLEESWRRSGSHRGSSASFWLLEPVNRKQREILGWAIKGQMMYLHRGPNAFWAKSGCGAFLTAFWSPEVG